MTTIQILNRHRTTAWIILIVVVAVLGYLAGQGGKQSGQAGRDYDTEISVTGDTSSVIWTCSMHPQIHQDHPGQCPICGMDLIPVTDEMPAENTNPREVTLSPAAEKLAGIETAPVERRFVARELTMVGMVSYDESRIKYITAWMPGRIERLYVDYTGIPVREGDHLVDIYSPLLYAAQEEYLQAISTSRALAPAMLGSIRDTAELTVTAAREKLRLLGMKDEQIVSFESLGRPSEQVTIYSPAGGIVIHKNATEGMYVDTGARIYTVADLSHVWVLLDVYESDIQWIRYGQEVEIAGEAYPGETFIGRIAFIDPVLDATTRTIKVRVNVPNNTGRLKPDMFVRAEVRSQFAAGGQVIDQYLAGRYLCQMHPEIVSSVPGTCDICGMDLVSAEQLGYASLEQVMPPLVIPWTAPLITGRRAVVFVADTGKPGSYTGREIVLGPRAGDYYEVTEGLAEGERVVVNGAFKLDSALQIRAKPSMMSPEGGVVSSVHNHGGTTYMAQAGMQTVQAVDSSHDMSGHDMDMMEEDLSAEVNVKRYMVPREFLMQRQGADSAYFAIRYALSHDSLTDAKTSAGMFLKVLAGVDMTLLEHDAHMAWMAVLPNLNTNAAAIAATDDIATARTAFLKLSEEMITVENAFGHYGGTIYRFHCPMADEGAGGDWLQDTAELENPFFGSAMLTCGSLEDEYPGLPE